MPTEVFSIHTSHKQECDAGKKLSGPKKFITFSTITSVRNANIYGFRKNIFSAQFIVVSKSVLWLRLNCSIIEFTCILLQLGSHL